MTQTDEKITLSGWLNKIFVDRGIRHTDGRHLYQYRITSSEFSELEEALRHYISIGQSCVNLGDLAKRPIFTMLFVLYGAEWWRRRYDGSGFTWEGILRDLGAKSAGWTQSQRSECVRFGLHHWKLKVLETTGFKYLGAIALEGGLPMKALADARGGIAHLLGRVLRTANNRTIILEDIHSWVESLQNYLPKSYRLPAIFTLLAETAWTILDLKQKARLDSGKEAIARLDSAVPDWRNQFPLPMEDRHAQSLIEQLVREAAGVRLQKPSICLPVERFLEQVSEKEWRLISLVELPETLEGQKIAGLFGADAEDLPRFADLSVKAGEKSHTMPIRRMAGNATYRFEGTTWDFTGNGATSEHIFRLSSNDGRVWTGAAMKGQALSDDLPWLFSAEDSLLRFIRQGAGGVIGKTAVLALPPDWTVTSDSETDIVLRGLVPNLQREVYEISGDVFVANESGLNFKVKIGSAEPETEFYEWRGRRMWLDFASPSVAFIGKPKIFRIDETGTAVLAAAGGYNCVAIGAPHINQCVGPVVLSYQPDGELKHKMRAVVLPDEARLSYKFADGQSGAVIFDGWQASNAIVKTPGVNFVSQTEGSSLILKLASDTDQRVPDRVTVDLFWHHTSTPVRLSVPFPAKGVRVFDGLGKQMPNGSHLAFDRLLGVRLSIMNADYAKKVSLELKTQTGDLNRKYNVKALPGALSLELRLTDYLNDLDHLLSLNDDPDAKVQVSVSIGGEKVFAFFIARYETLIERQDGFVKLNISQVSPDSLSKATGLKILAMNLSDQVQEPVELELDEKSSETEFYADFSPETKAPGAWLIYPAQSSSVNFRPTLWAVKSEHDAEAELAKKMESAQEDESRDMLIVDAIMIEPENLSLENSVIENLAVEDGETDNKLNVNEIGEGELTRVMNIANQYARKDALKKLIKALAADFSHPAWQEVTRLAALVGHLPLTTLDLWRRFARSASGMAALAVRCGSLPHGFVRRFEKELPFAWEAIPFTVWKEAIERSHKYCREIFPGDLAEKMFADTIQ